MRKSWGKKSGRKNRINKKNESLGIHGMNSQGLFLYMAVGKSVAEEEQCLKCWCLDGKTWKFACDRAENKGKSEKYQ